MMYRTGQKDYFENSKERGWEKKSLKSKKRIISGVEKLDTMRFFVGRFTSVSTEIEFLPSFW